MLGKTLLVLATYCLQASYAASTTADGERVIAGYVPSLVAAVMFGVMYGFVAIILWTHWARSERPKYMLPLTIGMSTMTIGFIIRIYYRYKVSSVGVYAVMTLFILLSPCAYLAQNYMLLKRLASSLSDQVATDCLLIRPTLLAKLFVWSDVLTFTLQAAGGGLSSTGDLNMSKIGARITTVALILQLVSYLTFCVLLITFGIKVARLYPRVWHQGRPSSLFFKESLAFVSMRKSEEWRVLYGTLCLTSIGIIVRSAFRVAEFWGDGYDSFLATHEVFIYTLDLLPLWIGMTCYVFVWPPRFINTSSASSSSQWEDHYQVDSERKAGMQQYGSRLPSNESTFPDQKNQGAQVQMQAWSPRYR